MIARMTTGPSVDAVLSLREDHIEVQLGPVTYRASLLGDLQDPRDHFTKWTEDVLGSAYEPLQLSLLSYELELFHARLQTKLQRAFMAFVQTQGETIDLKRFHPRIELVLQEMSGPVWQGDRMEAGIVIPSVQLSEYATGLVRVSMDNGITYPLQFDRNELILSDETRTWLDRALERYYNPLGAVVVQDAVETHRAQLAEAMAVEITYFKKQPGNSEEVNNHFTRMDNILKHFSGPLWRPV